MDYYILWCLTRNVLVQETLRFHSLFKALERPQPPEFPVDLQLLTECRERMKLAEQLHEVASKGPRSNIGESWVTQAAEALGVELDSESDDDSERLSFVLLLHSY